MRRSLALLLSTTVLVALPLKRVRAEDGAWPQIGGWGQAWAANTDQATAPPPMPQPTPRQVSAPTVSKSKNKKDDSDRPIKMSADEVTHDRDLDIVTARGSVEAFQGRRHLTADTVSYNIKQDMVAASGNVVLIEPSGEATKADYLELDSDFASGIAREIKYMAVDRTRFTAR